MKQHRKQQWKRAGLVLLASAILLGVAGWGLLRGTFGVPPAKGRIEGSRLPAAVIAEREAANDAAARAVGATQAPSQILFGDLHVHTTFSVDAFAFSLPVFQGEGAHPPADACDFARYCSGLDFWSINEHAEALAPRLWQEVKDSVRQCNAIAGDDANPDLVSFLGWEWTQASPTPENHFGHKNVILRDTEEYRVPTRPIAATQSGIEGLRAMRFASLMNPLAAGDYLDFNRYARESFEIPRCPQGVPVRDLPEDCYEEAADPGVLFEKLDDWGFPALVIPHGTSWGIHAPPGATLENQLTKERHDPTRQKLFEIYSGHGASEIHRDLLHVEVDAAGEAHCPAPQGDFEPCCWRAGEIIRERCDSLAPDECERRVEEARQNFAQAAVVGGIKTVFREQVVPGAVAEDWLECGQLPDSFSPAYTYRPQMSAQFGLALGDFEQPGEPGRFRFGLIASSDNHYGRAGTGYKELRRRGMSDARGMEVGFRSGPAAKEARAIPVEEISPLGASGGERGNSFFYTGGLVAAHSVGRKREAIFDALEQRHVYGTSGDRILLWFDHLNEAGERQPMGSELTHPGTPRFEVRAVGAFEELPGCPAHALAGLSAERLERLCFGECHNPSDRRKIIERIEVVRIRPQQTPDEAVSELIEDPWRTFVCAPDEAGCAVQFDDPDFERMGRETLYYVRAIQERTPAVNGDTLRCERDDDGRCLKTHPCFAKGPNADPTDDCLAPVAERAWSSPIWVRPARGAAEK
ncbi:MAG: DUF3604 domain-containing protein [Deltaproteobacteria bacterium]